MSGISPLLTDSGHLAVTNEEKANTLNAFFASVFTRENIDDNVPFLQEGSNSQGMTLSEIRVTPAAVTEKLGKLNKDKAQGPDNIPPRVLV